MFFVLCFMLRYQLSSFLLLIIIIIFFFFLENPWIPCAYLVPNILLPLEVDTFKKSMLAWENRKFYSS